jgi:hypothetical protein
MSFANPQATRTRVPTAFTPGNYTPVAVQSEGTNKVSAHLKGIDNALAGAGGSGETVKLTGQTIDGAVATSDPVYYDGVDWKKATASTDRPNGVKNGTSGEVVIEGKCGGLSGIVAGTDYYMADSGGLTTSETDTFVGVGLSSTEIVVDLDQVQVPYSAPTVYERHVATLNQTVFDLANQYDTGVNALNVFVNGLKQNIVDDYVETDYDTVTFNVGLGAGNVVEFVQFSGVRFSTQPSVYEKHTATNLQTVFSLTNPYTVGTNSLLVFVNGQKQILTDDYAETDTATVTFGSGLSAGDKVEFMQLSGVKPTTAPSSYEKHISTAAQTIFNLSQPYEPGSNSLWVFRNGVRQTVTTDYNETDTDTITFTAGLNNGDVVEFIQLGMSAGATILRQDFIATAGQTVFDLDFSYNVGSDDLLVFSGSILMRKGASYDYLETDGDTVTFNSGRGAGTQVAFVRVIGGAAMAETVRYSNQTIDGGVSTADPVYYDGTTWQKATSSTPRPTGIKNGVTGEIVIAGKCRGLTGLTAGSLYYAADAGGLTTNKEGIFIGVAVGSQTLSVSLDDDAVDVGKPTLYEKHTATAGQTVFNLSSQYSVGTNSLWVFRNGQRQTVGVTYTETDDTTVTFSPGLTVGDEVLFIQLGDGVSNLYKSEHTATLGQTVFDLNFNYVPGKNELIVFSGGALMRLTDDYTETDGDTITFVSGRAANEKIAVFRVGTGTMFGIMEVEANTAGVGSPNVISVSESGRVFTNEGTGAKNYHDLPSASRGLLYTFYCDDANGIRATADTGDTIRLAASVSAAAGNVESTTVGSSVTLLAINDTEWVATSIVGTWVVT